MAVQRSAETQLVARFASGDAARAAAAALRNDGFPPDRVALLGSVTPVAEATAEASRVPLRRVFWLGLIWGIVGGIIGVPVGWAFGAVFGGMWLQIAAWAMFLHVGGTLLGAYAAIADRRDRERVYRSAAAAPPLVRVRALTADEALQAEQALRSAGAIVVTRS